MKKLISFACVCALLISSLSSTASAFNQSAQEDNRIKSIFFVLGEAVAVEYQIDGNDIIYAKAENGTDIAEKIDDVVYLNGVKAATIYVSDVKELSAQPRTGWISVDNCPYGTASDYTKFVSARDVNIALENTIVTMGVSGLSLVLAALGTPTVAGVVATTIVAVAAGSKYDYAKTLYFREEIYACSILSNFYRQVNCTHYFDREHTDFATSGTHYQTWA